MDLLTRCILPVCISAFCLFLSIESAPAQANAEMPSQLRQLNAEHAQSLGALARQRSERIRLAKASYGVALDKLQREASAAGDLDRALAIKAEREKFKEEPMSEEERKTLPATVIPSRQKYDEEVGKSVNDALQQEIPILKRYVAALANLQIQITKTGNLNAAIVVREAKAGAEARLATLEAGTVKTVVPTPPTVVPAPSRSLPFAAQAIAVASKIEAKQNTEGTGPNTIVFDGPAGNGRRGAKGILLQADSETSRTGNSWTLRYTRGGTAYGLQMIHPVGKGQAIVYLNKDGVGIATMEAWRERGYSGGDTKNVRLTKAAEKVFPLVDGQEYEVISRMSPGGANEVFINGQLVATGRTSRVEPLSLEIKEGESFPNAGRGSSLKFSGENLPMKWNPGWAGILLGPLDTPGQHVCRELRFNAGLVEVPGVRR